MNNHLRAGALRRDQVNARSAKVQRKRTRSAKVSTRKSSSVEAEPDTNGDERDQAAPLSSDAASKTVCNCPEQPEAVAAGQRLCLACGGILRSDKQLLLAALRLWELKRRIRE